MAGVRTMAGQCGCTRDDRMNLYQLVTSLRYDAIGDRFSPITTLIPDTGRLPSLLRRKSRTEALHVGCVILMYTLTKNVMPSSEVIEALIDLVNRAPASERMDLVPLLIPFEKNVPIREKLVEILRYSCPTIPAKGLDPCFVIEMGVLMAGHDEWVTWVHKKLIQKKPDELRYRFATVQCGQSIDPAKSRLRRVLQVWSDNYGWQRPE